MVPLAHVRRLISMVQRQPGTALAPAALPISSDGLSCRSVDPEAGPPAALAWLAPPVRC